MEFVPKSEKSSLKNHPFILASYSIHHFPKLSYTCFEKYEEVEKNQLNEEGRVLEDRVVFCKYTR